jgi:hypothetical protein
MTIDLKKIKSITRKTRTETTLLEDRYLLSLAWDLMQEKDSDGQSRGTLPYTLKSINMFQTACKNNPENIRITHHLAIAYHAYAWDLETQNDPRAAKFWRLALEFWRKIISSGQFWREMAAKMIKCDSEISEDKAQKHIAKIRKNLYENLLDIHVAFIAYYHECGNMNRAAVHVDIVNAAQIPPAVSLRLVRQVYDDMTRSMPESINAGDYDSALETIQAFLKMFPEHIEGLCAYIDVAKNWLHSCSYIDDWDQIVSITKKIRPFSIKLTTHVDFANNPTAKIGLADMVKEIFYHSFDRNNSLLPDNGDRISIVNRDLAMDSFLLAIDFGRIAYASAPSGHEITKMLPVFLRNYVFCLGLKVGDVMESAGTTSKDILLSILTDLLESAIQYTEESLSYEYDENASQELDKYKELLNSLQF